MLPDPDEAVTFRIVRVNKIIPRCFDAAPCWKFKNIRSIRQVKGREIKSVAPDSGFVKKTTGFEPLFERFQRAV
jgi:hypothetical protein